MKRVPPRHLEFLTDDFSIWQHTVGREIDKTNGYALDDAARALLAAVELKRPDLATIYIGFIEKCCTAERVINFYTAGREVWDRPWSPDALAETYWALAVAVSHDIEAGRCQAIIQQAILPRLYELRQWLRARCYLVIGAVLIDQKLATELTEELLAEYRANAHADWPWPEEELFYGNAIIPYALLEAGRLLGFDEAAEAGMKMLRFLNGVCLLPDGKVHLVGNQGWYPRGGRVAEFGEQPIDAAYAILANVSAYRQTKASAWLEAAGEYLRWFWGANRTGEPLVNWTDGSVGDGIDESGVSPNRGAENVVCYLYAQEQLWPLLAHTET
jgi:hypothetical protein